jgi:sugar/nucleoside kinase (ribokinase family)
VSMSLATPGSADGDSAALLKSRPAVIAAGTYIMDVLGRPVSELPRGQSGNRLEEIRATAAGTAGGTAVDLARLGATVIAMGAIGDDAPGDFVVAALKRAGVDATLLRRRSGVPTSATILPIHPDGSRPAWHVPGANVTFCAADVDASVLGWADAIHLGGLTALPALDGAPAAALLAAAASHGLLTTADFLGVHGEDVQGLLAAVLPHVDILMPNESEARIATGASSAAEAAEVLHGWGARSVIVKCGPDGCVICDEAGVRSLPAHRAPVIDTTGCGDAFCAGVIVAVLAGWSVDAAAALGCATGALNLRGLGSDAGARDVQEALDFMRDTPFIEALAEAR